MEPVKEGSDIQKYFFDLWLGEHADAELEKVPADAVTTSGSGLDPHITLENAKWQLKNAINPGGRSVARAWAEAKFGEKATADQAAKIHDEIKELLERKSFAAAGRSRRRTVGKRAGGQSGLAGPLSEEQIT